MTTAYLPFALPDIGPAELQRVQRVLESGWLTTGAETKEFERRFAEFVGAKHAVAVNSCTAALHLALEAIGLEEDDEVITSPYTFAASAEVIRYFKAKPVFVDVDPRTLNIDPTRLAGAITSRTRAIIPIHIAGLAADLDTINGIARLHGIPVIEDAAHSFPTTYKGKLIGTFSDFTCFSFYATKTITTGEGGMICTENDEYADRCRIMALHGISRDAWKRYSSEGSWYYEIIAAGYKYNLTDMASALGLAQLEKAEAMASRRREIAARYNEAFGTIGALQTPESGGGTEHAWHLYMLRLNREDAPVDRGTMIDELKKLGIGTSVHFIPLHIHPYYRETYGYAPEDFPNAFREYEREVSLPIYSKMTDADVGRVIGAVRQVLRADV